jgi:hypothetical protein
MGITVIYLATFRPDLAPAWFRILSIISGFMGIVIMIPSMYNGLTREEDDYY